MLGNQLGSVAQALHRAGIATVLASRYPLSVAGSSELTRVLYQRLLVGLDSFEAAVLRARAELIRTRAISTGPACSYTPARRMARTPGPSSSALSRAGCLSAQRPPLLLRTRARHRADRPDPDLGRSHGQRRRSVGCRQVIAHPLGVLLLLQTNKAVPTLRTIVVRPGAAPALGLAQALSGSASTPAARHRRCSQPSPSCAPS